MPLVTAFKLSAGDRRPRSGSLQRALANTPELRLHDVRESRLGFALTESQAKGRCALR